MRFSLTSSLIRLFLLRSIKYLRRLCSQTDDISTYHQNPNLDDTSNYRQDPGAENRNYRDFQQIPNGLIGMVQGVVGNNIFRTQMIHSRMVITSQVVKESTEASESSQILVS
ncbi:hypothetical protein Pint_14516 [Pistacia integerrima]|uniref:Uncharacterized protein n=1 Tax=Pistacia integerrima TaxID=434235 RepID=A0ACC0Y7A2_9ROSI|nr:hypothetical protein Pint_14516 [Pistacia integerrima]